MLRRVVQHPHCHLAAQQPPLLVSLCVCHSHSRHGYPAVSLRRRQWNSLLALPQRVEARTSVRLAVRPSPSPPLPPTLRESSTSMLFVCPLHTPLSVQASSSPLKVCVYFVCAVHRARLISPRWFRSCALRLWTTVRCTASQQLSLPASSGPALHPGRPSPTTSPPPPRTLPTPSSSSRSDRQSSRLTQVGERERVMHTCLAGQISAS